MAERQKDKLGIEIRVEIVTTEAIERCRNAENKT